MIPVRTRPQLLSGFDAIGASTADAPAAGAAGREVATASWVRGLVGTAAYANTGTGPANLPTTAQADGRFARVDGTGNLFAGNQTFVKAWPTLTFRRSTNGEASVTSFAQRADGTNIWAIEWGAGYDQDKIRYTRYNASGTPIDAPYTLSATTGVADFLFPPSIGGQSMDARYNRKAHVSVREKGALGDSFPGGTYANDTAAFIAAEAEAFSTKRSVWIDEGDYTITNKVSFRVPVDGPGVTRARIFVSNLAPNAFNMAASSVIEVLGESTKIDGFGIYFFQPSQFFLGRAMTYADVVQYPRAIDVRAAARPHIGHIRIGSAWIGLDASGGTSTVNAGGLQIDFLEVSAWSRGWIIDGVWDSSLATRIHMWDFHMADTQQQTLLQESVTRIGGEMGHVDGMDLQHVTLWKTKIGLWFKRGADGYGSFGRMTAKMDGLSGVLVDHAAFVTWSGGYISQGATGVSGIQFKGGRFACRGIDVYCDPTSSGSGEVPLVTVRNDDATTEAQFTMDDCTIKMDGACDRTILDVQPTSNYLQASFVNNKILLAHGISRSDPLVRFNSSGALRWICAHNIVRDTSTGATFVQVVTNDHGILGPNIAPQWVNSLPTTNNLIKQF